MGVREKGDEGVDGFPLSRIVDGCDRSGLPECGWRVRLSSFSDTAVDLSTLSRTIPTGPVPPGTLFPEVLVCGDVTCVAHPRDGTQ